MSTHASDRTWRLQDAKAQFSQLVDAAMRGEPQHVTRRGKEAVVVLSASDYRRLKRGAGGPAPGIVAHLLRMPRGGAPFDPIPLEPRGIEFE